MEALAILAQCKARIEHLAEALGESLSTYASCLTVQELDSLLRSMCVLGLRIKDTAWAVQCGLQCQSSSHVEGLTAAPVLASRIIPVMPTRELRQHLQLLIPFAEKFDLASCAAVLLLSPAEIIHADRERIVQRFAVCIQEIARSQDGDPPVREVIGILRMLSAKEARPSAVAEQDARVLRCCCQLLLSLIPCLSVEETVFVVDAVTLLCAPKVPFVLLKLLRDHLKDHIGPECTSSELLGAAGCLEADASALRRIAEVLLVPQRTAAMSGNEALKSLRLASMIALESPARLESLAGVDMLSSLDQVCAQLYLDIEMLDAKLSSQALSDLAVICSRVCICSPGNTGCRGSRHEPPWYSEKSASRLVELLGNRRRRPRTAKTWPPTAARILQYLELYRWCRRYCKSPTRQLR